MSAPSSRVRAMGIFHAPVDLPKDVFHSKAEAIADAVLALPVSQRNLLKYELTIPNDNLDAYLGELGLPPPAGTVIITIEVETQEKLLEFAGDPDFQNIIATAKAGFSNVDSFIFTVDVDTKLDK
ncbi:hypothetical protein B0H14DRAFT_3125437 [Mycena olivaceomarginata]|nr:hypothetical protein B0H14DRAFT_3125437 [Mycena olivaceomarginata]